MQQRLKFYGWGLEGTGLDPEERSALFGFLQRRLGVENSAAIPPPRADEIMLRAPRADAPGALSGVLTAEPYERLLHTYGKSFPETVRAWGRDFSVAPDWVALPADEAQVAAVLDWAARAGMAVLPFGAGSSVVGGVTRDGTDERPSVSLDLRRMDRVLEVDRSSRAARIEGGIRGPALEAGLRATGLSLRHFPQSFEFSTLGGWIATRSGGHFATLGTHIDDFVESVRAVTPAGIIESRRLPGSGAGPSPDRLLIGSEGALGVITEAWVRLQDRPRFRGGAVFGFADFVSAARAVRAVAQAGLWPSNLRVIDAEEAGSYGVNEGEEALLILGFESGDHPVEPWMERAAELAADHGGRRHADEAAAARWRTAFIRMPYNRELTVPLGVINDTFETAITWDRFEAFHESVHGATVAALREATGRDGVVSTRITHAYPDGAAPYYTFSVRGTPGRLLEEWRHIKQRVSDALIAAGGTITHHHAVGRDHMPWYRQQRPALFGAALEAAKRVLDPAWIMNPGVLVDQRPAA